MRNRHQVPPDMMHREGHNDTSMAKMRNLDITTKRYQTNSKMDRVSRNKFPKQQYQGQERQGKTEVLPQVEGKPWAKSE